jgi:hypothetical protein
LHCKEKQSIQLSNRRNAAATNGRMTWCQQQNQRGQQHALPVCCTTSRVLSPRRCDAMGQLPEGAAQTSDKTAINYKAYFAANKPRKKSLALSSFHHH